MISNHHDLTPEDALGDYLDKGQGVILFYVGRKVLMLLLSLKGNSVIQFALSNRPCLEV